jgi:hypothetical protein
MFRDVVPAAPEATREWSQIYEFFRDSQEILNSLHIATAHFSAHLRRNAFDLVLTAIAFSSLDQSEIRAIEKVLPTCRDISAIKELSFMVELREEPPRALSLHEAPGADFEPAQHLFRPGSHESDDPESKDPIDPT